MPTDRHASAAASRHDNPDQWVSGGHEKFGTPVVSVRDGEHPAAYTKGDRVRFWIEDPAGYDEFTYEGTVVGVEDASDPPLLRVRWQGRDYVRLAEDLEVIEHAR